MRPDWAVEPLAAPHHSALLQEVGSYACTTDVVGVVEVDLNQLAKAAAVVVAQRLGIAKGLQDGVGLQHTPVHTRVGSRGEGL